MAQKACLGPVSHQTAFLNNLENLFSTQAQDDFVKSGLEFHRHCGCPSGVTHHAASSSWACFTLTGEFTTLEGWRRGHTILQSKTDFNPKLRRLPEPCQRCILSENLLQNCMRTSMVFNTGLQGGCTSSVLTQHSWWDYRLQRDIMHTWHHRPELVDLPIA